MKRLILSTGCLLLLALCVVPAFAQSDFVVHATAQRFERGLMIWRSDTSQIWVLTNTGRVLNFPPSRYTRLPDNPIRGNFLRPINGFGQIWGNFADVRAAIGLPTLEELGFDMHIAESQGTYYLEQLDGMIYQINQDNTWTRAPAMPDFSPPATIGGFDVQPLSVSRGGTVTVTWNLIGATHAKLEIWDTASNSLLDTIPSLPASGSAPLKIPSSLIGNAGIILTRDDAYLGLPRAEIVVNVLPGADHSVITSAAFQVFQNGFMVWRSDTGAVYAFSGSGGGVFYAYSQDFLQSLPDNTLGAPPNLVRPINGFGRVWGNIDWIRSALGWAIAPEQGYRTTIGLAQGSPASFILPGGRTVSLNVGGGWSFI